MTLPLGKHSGRHAFAQACEEAGLESRRRGARRGVRTLQGARRRRPRRVHPRARPGGDRVVTTYSIACLSGDGIGPEVMAQASRGMREASRLHGFALDERHVAVRRGGARCGSGTRSRPRRGTQRWTPTRSSPPPSTASLLEALESELDLRAAVMRVRRSGRFVTFVAPLRADAWEWTLDRAATAAQFEPRPASPSSAARTAGTDVADAAARPGRRPRRHATLDTRAIQALGLAPGNVRRRRLRPAAARRRWPSFPGASTRTACSPGAARLAAGPGIFGPSHGTATDIAGQGVADPSSMLLAAALMLGRGSANAVRRPRSRPRSRTCSATAPTAPPAPCR